MMQVILKGSPAVTESLDFKILTVGGKGPIEGIKKY